MNEIQMFDYLAQYRLIEGEILEVIRRVLESGRLILGEQVRLFEENFASYIGGGVCGVAVNSGTDALLVSLMALGVGSGDDVVTVANSAVPTVSAIRMAGARPVFCDINYSTGLIDLDQLDSVITRSTRAVVPVHLFGNMVDIPKVRSVIGGRKIFVIEDCAQAHGATLNGKMAGSYGDAAAFSFYPTKNLGAYGDAGMCISSDPDIFKDMKRIRMYGCDGAYYAEREGINSRLDEIQAAVLNVKLRHMGEFLDRRRALAAMYDDGLSRAAVRFTQNPGVNHACHLYAVKVSNRQFVRDKLIAKGIHTGIHYPYPIHMMRAYSFLGYRKGSLPNTELLAGEILSLPLYPELPDSSVTKVIAVLNDAVD